MFRARASRVSRIATLMRRAFPGLIAIRRELVRDDRHILVETTTLVLVLLPTRRRQYHTERFAQRHQALVNVVGTIDRENLSLIAWIGGIIDDLRSRHQGRTIGSTDRSIHVMTGFAERNWQTSNDYFLSAFGTHLSEILRACSWFLAALADGASNKAIARRLGISFHTAKFHVAAILTKLNADSRTEAVMRAAQLGLVML